MHTILLGGSLLCYWSYDISVLIHVGYGVLLRPWATMYEMERALSVLDTI